MGGKLEAPAAVPLEEPLSTLNQTSGEPKCWSGRLDDEINLIALPGTQIYIQLISLFHRAF